MGHPPARPTAVPYAVFGDPQSLNLYGYVRNDPVSRADADGHEDPKTPPEQTTQAQKQSFWQKFLSVFYVKASVGVALEVGVEVHGGKAKSPVKVGVKVGGDVKSTMTVTTQGVSVSATKEAQAGLNVGKDVVGPQTSTENVTVKNGEVLQNHEVEKSSSWLFGTEKAEGTVSKGDVGYGGEVAAGVLVVGLEIGIDTDKLMELAAPDK